jgi:hypothetical protein
MAGLIARPAVQADHAALEELFRTTSMGKRIQIGFERDPDYFAGAKVQAEEPCVRGFFDGNGRAVGLFSAGSRRVWLDGEIRMRYLSDLRIHPDWQGSSLLARGFRLLRREIFHPGEWAQTLVLEDNVQALELLTSRRGGLPEYRPAGRYVSWLLPEQRVAHEPGILVRRAGLTDIGAMQVLLDAAAKRRSFAGIVKLADLGNPFWQDLAVEDFLLAQQGQEIVGMMGLWDQNRYQRIRICGYTRAVATLRPFWNTIASVPLPGLGQTLPLRKATAIACREDDPAILRALLSFALARKDRRLLLLGLSAADPLVPALSKMRGRREYGRHFLVGWEGTPPDWREPFAFDAARI